MKDFYMLMTELKQKSAQMRLSDFTDLVLKESGYLHYLDEEAETPEEYDEMIDYIDKLKEALDEYEDSTDEPDIIDFMRINGVEGNNVDTALDEQDENRVKVMTMHNAKGLEFPYVYMAGMEEGLFPGYMAINSDDETELEEERRLCYVAITRAMKELTLTCAQTRMVKGQLQYQAASRFIKEMPFGLLDMNVSVEKMTGADEYSPMPGAGGTGYKSSGSFNRSGGSKAMGSFDSSGYGAASGKSRPYEKKWSKEKLKLGSQIEIKEPDYKAGDRVRSFKWGEGTVLSVTKGERDYEVEVDFDNTGVRKVFAGFAKLKLL